MNSAAAESQYARGVFNAFLNYRKRHGGNLTIPYMPAEDPKPAPARKSKPVPVAEPEVEAVAVEPYAAEQPDSLLQVQPVEAKMVERSSTPTPVQNSKSSAPVFKVQILTSSTKLKASDARFKGLSGVESYQEGGMYKYTVGNSENYQEIYQLRKSVAEKIPQAFIIAFKDGVRTDVNAAIREYKAKKK